MQSGLERWPRWMYCLVFDWPELYIKSDQKWYEKYIAAHFTSYNFNLDVVSTIGLETCEGCKNELQACLNSQTLNAHTRFTRGYRANMIYVASDKPGYVNFITSFL